MYIDGFLLPIQADKLDDYRAISNAAGKIWMEHGALQYKEAAIDEDNIHEMRAFSAAADVKPGETVVFAYILYNSKEHRDEVNAKVMSDERINEICGKDGSKSPFDPKRMAYGGFKTIVNY